MPQERKNSPSDVGLLRETLLFEAFEGVFRLNSRGNSASVLMRSARTTKSRMAFERRKLIPWREVVPSRPTTLHLSVSYASRRLGWAQSHGIPRASSRELGLGIDR